MYRLGSGVSAMAHGTSALHRQSLVFRFKLIEYCCGWRQGYYFVPSECGDLPLDRRGYLEGRFDFGIANDFGGVHQSDEFTS